MTQRESFEKWAVENEYSIDRLDGEFFCFVFIAAIIVSASIFTASIWAGSWLPDKDWKCTENVLIGKAPNRYDECVQYSKTPPQTQTNKE